MKLARHKHVKKVLLFYRTHFSIRPPYMVLIDGTFCKAALKFKINIADQLPKYLESEVKMCTTKCVKHECEVLGSLLYGPLQVLKQYEVVRCGHRTPVSATKCIYSIAKTNKHGKYIVATQDTELSTKVRKRSGIPLLYISHLAITVEDPSEASKAKASETEADRLKPTQDEFDVLKTMKKEALGEEEVVKKKKKRKGGPNPLSCLKSKKKKNIVEIKTTDLTKSRRKRKRKVHISSHVQDYLKNSMNRQDENR